MSEAIGSMGVADFNKASIGNYKGVMLCNRPAEFGGAKPSNNSGQVPFMSRVDPKVPIGWNPAPKNLPKVKRVKSKS